MAGSAAPGATDRRAFARPHAWESLCMKRRLQSHVQPVPEAHQSGAHSRVPRRTRGSPDQLPGSGLQGRTAGPDRRVGRVTAKWIGERQADFSLPNTKAKPAICVPSAPVGNEEDSAQQFVGVQARTCRFG